MGSDTSIAWYQSIDIRLPRACIYDTSVIDWCHELLYVGIACALR